MSEKFLMVCENWYIKMIFKIFVNWNQYKKDVSKIWFEKYIVKDVFGGNLGNGKDLLIIFV